MTQHSMRPLIEERISGILGFALGTGDIKKIDCLFIIAA